MDSKLDRILTAVYQQDLNTLRRASRTDLNRIDADGRTPLMHAVLAEAQPADLLKFLCEQTDDLDQGDSREEWTALHFAARDGKQEAVRTLLNSGAAVDPENTAGNTPLFLTITGLPPEPALVEILLQHGADPDHKNQGGVSPLSLAQIRRWDSISSLFSRAAKPKKPRKAQ